jgi:hypothetical protein
LPTITPILTTVLPTLSDAWLLGLTDAEGCFSISLLKNSKGFRIIYSISQKWDENKIILEHIAFLLGKGTVWPHSRPLHWDLRVNGLKNCKVIFAYFSIYQLKTKKLLSYKLFLEIHARLTAKDHLDPIKRVKLKKLARLINPDRGRTK